MLRVRVPGWQDGKRRAYDYLDKLPIVTADYTLLALATPTASPRPPAAGATDSRRPSPPTCRPTRATSKTVSGQPTIKRAQPELPLSGPLMQRSEGEVWANSPTHASVGITFKIDVVVHTDLTVAPSLSQVTLTTPGLTPYNPNVDSLESSPLKLHILLRHAWFLRKPSSLQEALLWFGVDDGYSREESYIFLTYMDDYSGILPNSGCCGVILRPFDMSAQCVGSSLATTRRGSRRRSPSRETIQLTQVLTSIRTDNTYTTGNAASAPGTLQVTRTTSRVATCGLVNAEVKLGLTAQLVHISLTPPMLYSLARNFR
ncbi:hypothetical protein FIBSPDRAFT_885594 [Athelia psychrophila]|uniref:Uncharacterized protein n=1 Tax=Athelia psychrophila TaxID=1759441 RepID=A0A166RWV8_9AGAM|nr:hypothetical protein FIBSPDRAFT_885594 [Fibularhizoctonia sp. CBS 109695]